MNPSQRGPDALVWGLVALLAVATLGFGTVHAPMRAVLAVGGLVLVALRVRSPTRMPALVAGLGLAGVVLVAAGLLFLVPIGDATRQQLQPLLAGPMGGALDRLGHPRHALSVEPRATLDAMAVASSMLGVAWLAALVVRTRTRRLRLTAGVLSVCAGVAVVGLLHQVWGLESIYGVTGVPAGPTRERFFAPFVNPNNAGLFCVVGIPLALGIGRRRDPAQTAARVVAGALCLAGVVMSGSRGALLAGLAAGVVFVLVAAPRAIARTTGALVVLLGAVLLAIGPAGLVDALGAVGIQGATSLRFDSGRLEIWSVAWQLARESPLTGVGPGGFGAAWRVVETGVRFGDAVHAHNDALQVLAEQGLLLGGLWVGWVLAPLVLVAGFLPRLRHGRRRLLLAGHAAAYAAIWVASLVSFPAHIGALALTAAILGGGLVGAVAQDRRALGPGGDRLGRAGMLLAVVAGLGSPVVWMLGGTEPAVSDNLPVLDATLVRSPLWSRGWLLRAELHLAEGDAAAALSDLDVAAQTWPTSPWPHVARARLLRRMGQPRAARAAWRRALSLNFPHNDPGRKWVAIAIEGESDPMNALTEVVPDRADRLRDAGFVARSAGDPLTALIYFQRAHDRDPALGLPLVRQHLDDGFPKRARTTLDGLPDATRLSCRGLVLDADIALSLGAPEEALSAGRAAIRECDEADESAWISFVRARLATGDADAIGPMTELVVKYPARHGLRRHLLAGLRAAGDYEVMVVHLEALARAGVATEAEQADLERLRKGLPPTL